MSKDGKYHYWECTVSGLMTFAKPDYWQKVMAKFKTEENLAKTYVCRKAQKLLDAGMSPEKIREMLNDPMAKKLAAKTHPKEPKEPKAKKAGKRGRPAKIVTTEQVKTETGEVKTVERVTYPWSHDPTNYFKSLDNGFVDVSEVTKTTCIYPNRYLDDQCYGCSSYAKCSFTSKYTEDDWKKGKKKDEVKIRRIVMD